MFPLATIREALRRHRARRLRSEADACGAAAVALVLAGPPEDLRLCLIRRAEREGDHWSGQMAFPGGRAEACDATPRDVAERETREEVGLELREAEFLGPLSEIWIRHSGRVTRDVLSPFVYYAGERLPEFELSHEVAEAYWAPLRHLWDPANWTRIDYERLGRPVELPGIRYGEGIIWGLTYMMLRSLGEILGAPLPGE